MPTAQRSSVRTIIYGVLVILAIFVLVRVATVWTHVAVVEARDAESRARAANNLIQVQEAIEAFNAGPEASGSDPLRVVSWNVESDGNDPALISEQLVGLGRYDVYALQEVHPRNYERYGAAIRKGFGNGYRFLVSNTGRSDRLVIIFDSERLELHEARELFSHEGHTLNDWRHRSPLVAEFADRLTGVRFLFVTVHLARGSAKLRQEQATGLRQWAVDQDLPIVAAGDFNFDYDFPTKKGNRAFDNFLQGGTWRWIKPDPLIDTNWSDSDGDGIDNYPSSMLDFAFVAGIAAGWAAECDVVKRDGDFPDDERSSDHRPVSLEVISDR